MSGADVNDCCCCVAVAAPQVKTWFIIRRLFEPKETSDAVPAGGGGDAAAPVIVRVENAVVDGGVMKEVMSPGFYCILSRGPVLSGFPLCALTLLVGRTGKASDL